MAKPAAQHDAKPAVRRRYDLDLLFVWLLAGVIGSHVLLIFTPGPYLPPYSVKNGTLYKELWEITLLPGFAGMPAFFILAGWTSLIGLRIRGPRQYLVERAKRLLIPLVLGMILITPIIKYYELLGGFHFRVDGIHSGGPIQEGFWRFFPNSAFSLRHVTWAHLYFLAYLAFVSAVTLPALAWIAKRAAGRRRSGTDGGGLFCWAYIPMILPVVHQVLAGGFWPFYPNFITDWDHLSLFALYFVMGAVIAGNPVLERALRREWWRMGLLGLGAFALYSQSPETTLGIAAGAIVPWCVFAGLLGVAERTGTIGGPALKYFRDATLPVYVVHNVFIVAIGFHVVRQDWPDMIKVAVILVVAMGVTMAVYHLLIRPIPILRVLFGMRPLRKRPASAPAAAQVRALRQSGSNPFSASGGRGSR